MNRFYFARALTVCSTLVTATSAMAGAAFLGPVKRMSAESTLQVDGSTRLTNIRFLRGDAMYPIYADGDKPDDPKWICKYLDKGKYLESATMKAANIVVLSFTENDVEYVRAKDASAEYAAYKWIDCEKNNATKKVVADKKTQLDGTIHLSNILYLRGPGKLPIVMFTSQDLNEKIAASICAQFGLGKVIEQRFREVEKPGDSVSVNAMLGFSEVDHERTYSVLDWIDCEDL